MFILIISCTFILTGILSADKNTSKFDLLFNEIKTETSPLIFNKIENAKNKFVRSIHIMKGKQDYTGIAYRKINLTCKELTGLDVHQAAFLVLHLATKDMDSDIGVIMQIISELKSFINKVQKNKDAINDMIQDIHSSQSNEINKSMEQLDEVSKNPAELNLEAENAIRMFCRKPTPIVKKKKNTPHFRLGYMVISKISNPAKFRNCPKPFLLEVKADIESDLKDLTGLSKELSLKLRLLIKRRSEMIQTLSNLKNKIANS